MSMGVECKSIYYNVNENTFEDDDGDTDIYDISEILENDQIIYYKRVGGTCYAHVDGEDYEVVFPIPEEERTLYYDIEENVMYNEYGDTVFNIFSIISPNDLYLFKRERHSKEVPGVNGGSVELIWPPPINY
ncbi:MAG: hypothetical protein WCS56_00365 [Bacilli bacterium]